MRLRFMGIDPGFAKSCGWAIVELVLGQSESVVQKIVDCGVVDVGRVGKRVASGSLAAVAEKYGVAEVMIEDFQHWREDEGKKNANGLKKQTSGGHKRRSSYYVVARMQNLIGYLNGFLSARYIPVTIVHPNRWRARVSNEELQGLKLPSGLNKSDIPHVLSAIGVVLGELRARN